MSFVRCFRFNPYKCLHDVCGALCERVRFDNQGRDQILEGSLALDKDGKFIALRWRAMQNAGAYVPGSGYIPAVFSLRIATSVYDIPEIDISSRHVFTNTTPTSAG